MRVTVLMRHGGLWVLDPWYRRAWFAGPQVAGLLVIGWLFAVPHSADPPALAARWMHPIHSADESTALRQVRDRAISDPTALAQLEQKATAGNSLAQFYMGTLTDPKLKFQPATVANTTKSITWYRKAADQGVDIAAVNLGILLLVGQSIGTESDIPEARKLFEKAAPTMPVATRELGLMKKNGWGEPADPVGGLQILRIAAERGDAFAQRLVADAFDRGEAGVSADAHEAVIWLQKAASGGDAVAMRELGTHLKNGNGTAADVTAAMDQFRKAAAKGDAPAQVEVDAANPQPKP